MNSNIHDDPQFQQGHLYAIRLLTASKKSTSQLRKRLKDKGYRADVIQNVLDALNTQGILNDRKMVDESVQWAKQAKRYGKRRIALELKKKGIAEAVINESLVDYSKDEERETAKELAAVRWEKLSRLDPMKKKKRLYDFLISRGFDFEVVRETVDELNKSEKHENF